MHNDFIDCCYLVSAFCFGSYYGRPVQPAMHILSWPVKTILLNYYPCIHVITIMITISLLTVPMMMTNYTSTIPPPRAPLPIPDVDKFLGILLLVGA